MPGDLLMKNPRLSRSIVLAAGVGPSAVKRATCPLNHSSRLNGGVSRPKGGADGETRRRRRRAASTRSGAPLQRQPDEAVGLQARGLRAPNQPRLRRSALLRFSRRPTGLDAWWPSASPNSSDRLRQRGDSEDDRSTRWLGRRSGRQHRCSRWYFYARPLNALTDVSSFVPEAPRAFGLRWFSSLLRRAWLRAKCPSEPSRESCRLFVGGVVG